MPMLKSLSITLVMFTVLLSGCASFEKKELDRVSAFPSTAQYTVKPSVYVDLHVHRGEPGPKAKEQSQGLGVVQPIVENALARADMFSSYSFDPAARESSDYTLRIDAYNHGNAIGAAVMGFICGYSLGIIPAAATDNYTLHFKTMNNRGEVLKEYANKDAVTTWMGLWFIPVMNKTPKKAIESTLGNQITLALQELIDNGTIIYPAAETSTRL